MAYASALAVVCAHTPEVEFLRTRLAVYQATTPRDLNAPIPSMEVTDAGVFIIHDTDRRHPIDLMFDPTEGAAPQAPVVAAEVTFQEAAFEAAGEAIARRASEVEEDIQTVDRELREANDGLALLGAEHTTAADTRRHAIESGRIDLAPARFPTRTRILLCRAWIALTLVGEWVAFFFALANSIGGIDPAALEAEWAAGSAWAITGAAVVAATVVGATFILAEWAGAQLHSARDADEAPARNLRLWTATFGAGIVASVLVVAAVMRAQLAGEPTDLAALLRYAILTAAPLIAAVVAHGDVRDLENRRAAARIGAPDQHNVASDLRQAEERRWIAERERLRALRSDLIAALLRLQASVAGGNQALRDIARFELFVASTWLDTLAAAIARDKTAFRTCARLLKREQLLATPAMEHGALIPLRRRRTA